MKAERRKFLRLATGAAVMPYRGEAPTLTDLIGGQVQVMFVSIVSSAEHIWAGRLRALAVTTAKRSDLLPNIPTVDNFLPGYDASAWFGVGVPKNTPAEIIDRLNTEINSGLAARMMKARFADLGGTVLPGSPADFGRLILDETEKWAKVIKLAGLTIGFRSGSIPVAELRGRHGRTCFNTGRQVTHLLCRFLIDEMSVSTNGNRHARSTPESRRHGRRPWIPEAAVVGAAMCSAC